MFWCHHHNQQHCGCECANPPFCPFPQWKHPLLCNPAHLCCANNENGPTLVIHQILLDPCGNPSCTPRSFTIRITGPSYPCGETFTLRAGSCTQIDEPLVITQLEPGQYEIDLITGGCNCSCGYSEYDTTFTGPVSGGCVSITASPVPTVITIVTRKRLNRRRRRGCGCHAGCGAGWHNGYGC